MAEVEFRKAVVPDEVVALCDFDRATFHTHPADVFTGDEWKKYESYWMLVDHKIVGCTALEPNGGDLWIASTAILPEFQKKGWGKKLKRWQIDYAKAVLHALLVRRGKAIREVSN